MCQCSYLHFKLLNSYLSFAAGSATGLRGLLSYILGSFSGTALFGILADKFGWDAGFYLLLFAVAGCIFCCYMTHLGVLRLERKKITKQLITKSIQMGKNRIIFVAHFSHFNKINFGQCLKRFLIQSLNINDKAYLHTWLFLF